MSDSPNQSGRPWWTRPLHSEAEAEAKAKRDAYMEQMYKAKIYELITGRPLDPPKSEPKPGVYTSATEPLVTPAAAANLARWFELEAPTP